jgi:hypothetical protein
LVRRAQQEIATVTINIKKLDVKYYEYQVSSDNLLGSISLEIVFKKGNKTIKKVVNMSESTLKPIASDASSFEDFIYELMSNSIVKTTKIIINTLKTI